ncbi:MAG TPA: glycosyltransferase [Pyrinomonadaceae bacterium]|nr:glycosyltransferase [Pyrinomonadaceae bacterium]
MKMKIGILNLHMQARGGGEKKTLVLAEHLSRRHDVLLFSNEQLNRPSLERYFDVDLSRIRFVLLNQRGKRGYSPRNARLDNLTAQFSQFRQIKALELEVFINNSHCSILPCPSARGIYMCMFPHKSSTWIGKDYCRRAYHLLMDRAEKRLLGCRVSDFIDSYAAVTANSCFTAEWVNKMWGRRAEVIYSTCDSMGPPAAKEKIILNVGRFLRGGPGTLYKQQHVLLDVFKQLTAVQQAGWQLHFAGSMATDEESKLLVKRLKDAAKGCSVFFHFDATHDALRDLYRRASLYWHATGYGFPAGEQPELQEHFGLTTIEAMSAGAVPVVINSGGQRETVTHAIDGFLWNELSSLADQTIRLINDPHLMEQLSRQAMSSSARFSRAAFNNNMDIIIRRLMPN